MEDLLRRLGWSQVYFAARIGVDKETVGRWAKNKTGHGYTVAMAHLEFVARMLGV